MSTTKAPASDYLHTHGEFREMAMKLDPSGHLYREGERMSAAILAMDESLELELADEPHIVTALASENQVLVWLDATFKDSIPALDPVHDWVREHDMVLVEKTTVPRYGSMSLKSVVYWYQSRDLIEGREVKIKTNRVVTGPRLAINSVPWLYVVTGTVNGQRALTVCRSLDLSTTDEMYRPVTEFLEKHPHSIELGPMVISDREMAGGKAELTSYCLTGPDAVLNLKGLGEFGSR